MLNHCIKDAIFVSEYSNFIFVLISVLLISFSFLSICTYSNTDSISLLWTGSLSVSLRLFLSYMHVLQHWQHSIGLDWIPHGKNSGPCPHNGNGKDVIGADCCDPITEVVPKKGPFWQERSPCILLEASVKL